MAFVPAYARDPHILGRAELAQRKASLRANLTKDEVADIMLADGVRAAAVRATWLVVDLSPRSFLSDLILNFFFFEVLTEQPIL